MIYKQIKNFILVLVVILLTTAPCSLAGEYAADFLRIGVGARAMAMGGAFSALANDATAFYWNPAGLSHVRHYALHVDHVPMFDGLAQFNTAHFAMALNKRMTIGLGWIRHGVDDIPRYGALPGSRLERLTNTTWRSTGEPEGYFQDSENAVFFTFSRAEYLDLYFNIGMNQYLIPLEFYAGLSGKYIRHSLDNNSGAGQGLDAGFILRFVSDKYVDKQAKSWFGIAATARDLSRTSIAWDTATENKDLVQTLWLTGVAGSHLVNLLHTRFTLTCDKEFGFFDDFRYGAEMTSFKILSIRGGYYRDNFSAGAGIMFKSYAIDYAFISHDLANTHRISGYFSF